MVDTEGISCCFDGESTKRLKDCRKKGLDETSQIILSALEARGLRGSTVLELGCGVGALTIELAKAGAASARGVDLSPKMLQAARVLASESSVSNSVNFEIGDGASAELPSSDMVVLDAVLCCYPDVEALVENSSSAARRFYAISIPDDRHFLVRLLKPLLVLQPLFGRGTSFRFFLHSTLSVMERLQRKGFELALDSSAGRIWSVLIFSAPTVPTLTSETLPSVV